MPQDFSWRGLIFRVVFHRILTTSTPIGRRARGKTLSHATPLIRTKGKDLARAGVIRVPRTVGVQNGRPVLEDGQLPDVSNVIWCTGFEPSSSWVDLPVFDERGEPRQERGVATRPAGTTISRPPVSLCHVVVDDPWRKPGREVHRGQDCGRGSRGGTCVVGAGGAGDSRSESLSRLG